VLPVNNLCADVKNHQIILKWQFDDLNNNFSHYNIYKSTTYFTNIEGLSPYATISNVNDTTFIDNNVDLCVQYYYTVTTVSKNGYENDHIYVLGPVVDFEISIIKTALDTGIVGEIYSDTLQAQGGSPPYIWKIVDNVLPAGLNLDDSTGVICGIPIISGSYNFTVKVTDSHPQPYFTTQQLSLIIITPVSVNVNESKIPDQTFLYQNYPNPFNNQTIIRYQLNGAGHVSIKIFDILGRKIRSLIDVEKTVGYYQIVWDGRDDQRQFVGSGTYFYEMRVGDFMQKCKVLLLK